MSQVTKTSLNDRLKAAAEAKQAMLKKFQARPAADDPAVVARQEARRALDEARTERLASREAARAEQAAREAADREQREAADLEQRKRAAAEATEREAALEAERKTARDARYAARKARR